MAVDALALRVLAQMIPWHHNATYSLVRPIGKTAHWKIYSILPDAHGISDLGGLACESAPKESPR
jgi:hypothetical protein